MANPKWKDMVEELQRLQCRIASPSYANRLFDELIEHYPFHTAGLRDRGVIYSALILSDVAITDTDLPAQIAGALFGDPGLVYDVRDQIRNAQWVDRALMGSPPGFDPVDNTLPEFVKRHRQGVIVFDDLQAFPSGAITTIAQCCDKGLAPDVGQHMYTISSRRFVVFAVARIELPSRQHLDELAAGRKLIANPDGPRSDPSVSLTIDSFESLITEYCDRHYRAYLSPWVRARFFDLIMIHPYERYLHAASDRERRTPLLSTPSDAPSHPPSPHPRDLIDDVRKAIPIDRVEVVRDVFLSYRHRRDAGAVKDLKLALEGWGVELFFDQNSLRGVDFDSDEKVKTDLIRALVNEVRSSRCTIAFAAEMEPFRLPEGMDQEEALQRGLAMRTPNGPLIQWNWQTLELQESREALVIDSSMSRLYVIDEGHLDNDFGNRRYETRAELHKIVRRFLESRGMV